VAALLVIEDLDPLEDRLRQLLSRGPVLAVEELGLQCGKEALGDGVVEGVADAAIEPRRPAERSR
jgi:hypothetical protein